MGTLVRSAAFLALLVFTVTIIAIALSGEDVTAQLTEIKVTILEEDRDQTAHPTDVANDLLTFSGDVALNRAFWPPGSVTIELSLVISGDSLGWEVFFDPEFHTFTSSAVQNFTAAVVVPEEQPAGAFHNLVFNANATGLLLPTIEPGYAQVEIAQYYKIGRQYSTAPLRVTQGEMVEFNITLANRGNGEDTFLLEVSNEAELLNAGLTVIYERSTHIDPGHEDSVDLRLQAADDALVSEFSLNLTIRSEGSASDPDVEDTVTSGAEWTVVVEEGLTSIIFNNLYIIVPGVAIALVFGIFLIRRRRKRGRLEAEAEDANKPAAYGGKKKKKKKGKKEEDNDGDD
jgi:hypothetical protein